MGRQAWHMDGDFGGQPGRTHTNIVGQPAILGGIYPGNFKPCLPTSHQYGEPKHTAFLSYLATFEVCTSTAALVPWITIITHWAPLLVVGGGGDGLYTQPSTKDHRLGEV